MSVPSIRFQPQESWPPVMDFSARLAKGETITSVTSVVITPVTVPPLVAGASTFNSTQVQFNLSGGVDDTKYTVTVKVLTSSGTRIGVGFVQLLDDGE